MAKPEETGYIEPNVESLPTEAIPAPEVPGPFLDDVESEVPLVEYIEPFVLDDAPEAAPQAAPTATKTAAKKSAKK